MGVDVHHVPVDALGLSPVSDARLFVSYFSLFRRLRPSAILAFTIKPNIYGSIAASRLRIPIVNTLTGLGTGFLSGSALQTVVEALYRFSLRHSRRVFFHNADDRDLFVRRGLVTADQAAVVGGSGVDLEHFASCEARTAIGPPSFIFVGRLLKDKGAREFLEAAKLVSESRSALFRMLGSFEAHPKAIDEEIVKRHQSTVEILGPADDVRPHIAHADCVVLPSYREGLPRALLEASAMAKPVIATDVPGCRQAVEDGVTGLLCDVRSAESLAAAMIAMIDMTPEQRSAMGRSGRAKVKREFSEQEVVAAYLKVLGELIV
jgi:glycosyltransferase involved in cell wall biosynthesis